MQHGVMLAAHPPCSLPRGVTPGAARHLPLGRRGPATVSSPPQALGLVGVVCGCACVFLRHCLCINKPILGVQAWPGFGLPMHARLLRLFATRIA